MISLSAQDILVSHIQVCHALGVPADLSKPSVLNDIEAQLKTNLQWFDGSQVAAYVGMQISKLKPFSYANNATATSLTIALRNLSSTANKLTGKDIAKVSALLSSSSVVDDIADQLS